MSLENSLDGVNRRLSETAGYAERVESALAGVSKNAGNFRTALAGLAGVSGTTSGVGGKTPLGGGANFSTSGGGGGSTNMMANSLGSVSAPPVQPRGTTTPSNVGGGGGGGGSPMSGGGGSSSGSGGKRDMLAGSLAVIGGVANASWQMTPGVMDAAAYQAALFPTAFASEGPYSNQRTANQIFAAAGKGASGVFDMQAAAALATSKGFTFNLNGGSTMANMLGASSFAYQMTGMNNVAAMQGQTAMYQGTSGVSSRLMRIGMFNVDPTSGKPKDMGQIVDELWARFFGSKTAKVSLEQFDADLAMGFLGSELAALFGDQPALYEQVVSFMRVKAKAGGRAGMTTNVKSGNFVGKVAEGLGMTEYNSPQVASGMVNTSRSKMVGSATESGLMNAYVNSAYLLEDFNSALKSATDALGPLSGMYYNVKGLLQTVGGSEMSPILGLLTAPLRMLGMATGGVTGRGTSTSDSVPAMLSKGEYVINARAASQIGVDNLNALNSMGHAFGSGYASPAKNFATGGTTLSGHEGLKSGDDRLKTFNVPGTQRSIRVADWAGPIFQSFLSQWQNDPLLGGGRFNLNPGPLDSYNYRQARISSGLSDHAGYAIDVRYDILKADGKRHMTPEEDAAVRRLLSSHPQLGWGGDYQNTVDEMHFFMKSGTAGKTSLGRSTPATSSSPDDSGDGSLDLGSGESIFKSSVTGADAAMGGISSSTYATSGSTSLPGLGSTGGSMGSFTSGFVSATNVANNLSTISIMSSSLRGVTDANDSPGGVGTSRSLSVGKGKPELPISGPTRPSRSYGASMGRILGMLQSAGLRGERLREAWAIMMRESSGRPTAHNDNRATGDDSYGLFQINMLGNLGPARLEKFKRFGIDEYEDLFDPWKNIQAMAYMSQKGNNWSSWVGPQYGRASDYYKEFPAVAKKHNIPGYSAGTPYVANDQLAYLHQGETVIPAQATPDFRRALFEMLNGNGKAKTVNITLNIEKASDEEAERFARKVKRLLENESKMERLRSR